MLLIEIIVSVIIISGCIFIIWIRPLLPLAFSMLQTLLKMACISIAIFPFVHSMAFWLSKVVLADKTVTVAKKV